MKIGTLTFHRAQNYGGVLQSYALVKFLQMRGYDAEIVDYHCPKIEAAYKLWNTKSIKSLIASAVFYPRNLHAKRIFEDFRKRYLTISSQSFYKAEDFTNQYDLCIMGSDQVWTLRLVGGFNPVFYGDFSSKIRKVGYAVSVAEIGRFSDDERLKMSDCIINFSHFSTREESFGKEMARLSGKEVKTVIDPSLLLSKEEYESIIEEPEEKDYVLYYQQEFNPHTKELIVDVARQVGAKMIVVVTGPKEDYGFPYRHYSTSNLSVNKYLGLFKNAKVIFTSSFHGTAYSLVFRKDFYFVETKAPDRAKNLLRKCDAMERVVLPTDKAVFSRVDYSKIEPKLLTFRDYSIDYLINAIENK